MQDNNHCCVYVLKCFDPTSQCGLFSHAGSFYYYIGTCHSKDDLFAELQNHMNETVSFTVKYKPILFSYVEDKPRDTVNSIQVSVTKCYAQYCLLTKHSQRVEVAESYKYLIPETEKTLTPTYKQNIGFVVDTIQPQRNDDRFIPLVLKRRKLIAGVYLNECTNSR